MLRATIPSDSFLIPRKRCPTKKNDPLELRYNIVAQLRILRASYKRFRKNQKESKNNKIVQYA